MNYSEKILQRQAPSFEARILDLLELADGWLDGDGKAVSKEAAKDARAFARALKKEERDHLSVFPTSEGGLEITAVFENSRWVIEITPDGFLYDPDFDFDWESSIEIQDKDSDKETQVLYPKDLTEAQENYVDFFQLKSD